MNFILQVSNADENLLKTLKSVVNLHPQAKLRVKKGEDITLAKLSQPYKTIGNSEVPNKETLKATKTCGKGHSKTYKKFSDFVGEVKQEIKNEA